jgi:hypothetical protein
MKKELSTVSVATIAILIQPKVGSLTHESWESACCQTEMLRYCIMLLTYKKMSSLSTYYATYCSPRSSSRQHDDQLARFDDQEGSLAGGGPSKEMLEDCWK